MSSDSQITRPAARITEMGNVKEAITHGAAQRRRDVEAAYAEARLEGQRPPCRPVQEVFERFINNEIKTADLVTAVKQALGLQPS